MSEFVPQKCALFIQFNIPSTYSFCCRCFSFTAKEADTIRKITFTNDINGLACSFSTDTPLMFLESIDGCSCGSSAVTYKPVELDGQRLISTNLNARTVQFTVNFGGIEGGRYSRRAALKRWEEIQRVFVPGQMGTLVWTDGENGRFIRCRCSAAPKPAEILPYLFKVSFSMTADSPLWYDTVENVVEMESGAVTLTIDNDCGIAVPMRMEVAAASSVFAVHSVVAGAGLSFGNVIGEGFTIDTESCTVISDSGEYVNHLLSVDSEFFYIMPGVNRLNFAGSSGVAIHWRRAFMGVY